MLVAIVCSLAYIIIAIFSAMLFFRIQENEYGPFDDIEYDNTLGYSILAGMFWPVMGAILIIWQIIKYPSMLVYYGLRFLLDLLVPAKRSWYRND